MWGFARAERTPTGTIDDFKTENWKHFTPEQRMECFQRLENDMAKEQGRPPRKLVETTNIEVHGFYDHRDPDYIVINNRYLTGEWNQFNGMNTVIHEGRHAYQDDWIQPMPRVYDPNDETKERPSQADIEEWTKNRHIYYDAGLHPVENRCQPVEVDANNYASQKMESLRSEFESDKNFQKYTKNLAEEEAQHAKRARGIYGSAPEDAVKAKLHAEYNENPPKILPSKQDSDNAYDDYFQYAGEKYGLTYVSQHQDELLAQDMKLRELYQAAFPERQLPPMSEAKTAPVPAVEGESSPIKGEKPSGAEAKPSGKTEMCGAQPTQEPNRANNNAALRGETPSSSEAQAAGKPKECGTQPGLNGSSSEKTPMTVSNDTTGKKVPEISNKNNGIGW